MKTGTSKLGLGIVGALFASSFVMPAFVDGGTTVTGAASLWICATILWDSNPPPGWFVAYLLGFLAANAAFVFALFSAALSGVASRGSKLTSGVALAYVASWVLIYRFLDPSPSAHPTLGYFVWLISFAGLFGLVVFPRMLRPAAAHP